MHDSGTPDDPKCRGIYIDNYSRNFVVHHNVVWNVGRPGVNKGVHIGAPSESVAFLHNTLIGALPPTGATYTKFPLSNPDRSFWTAERNHVRFVFQNNLCLPAATPPTNVFQDPEHGDYRPRTTSPAIDPTHQAGVVRWETPDGKVGVPAGFVLFTQDRSVQFSYEESNGHGVRLHGINDDLVGPSPDDGAYEHGRPIWRPGCDGAAQIR